jgi:hypothetical protein
MSRRFGVEHTAGVIDVAAHPKDAEFERLSV